MDSLGNEPNRDKLVEQHCLFCGSVTNKVRLEALRPWCCDEHHALWLLLPEEVRKYVIYLARNTVPQKSLCDYKVDVGIY